MCITMSTKNFKHPIINGKNGHVKCSSTQVKYKDILLIFYLKSISNSSSSRLIQHPDHIQSCNGSCIFCCLSLGIIKVGRNRNDSSLNILSYVWFGNCFHFAENHSWYFLWCICCVFTMLAGDGDVWSFILLNNAIGKVFSVLLDDWITVPSPDESFHVINSSRGVDLCFRHLPNQYFIICEGDNRRSDSVA